MIRTLRSIYLELFGKSAQDHKHLEQRVLYVGHHEGQI